MAQAASTLARRMPLDYLGGMSLNDGHLTKK
jgi:hypothetical protein